MDIPQPSLTLAAPRPRRKERLVFALMYESRDRARELFDREAFTGADIHWLEPGDMAQATWETTLRALRPSVLVLGWGSPRLPDAIVDDPEFPLRYVCHLAGTVREFLPRRLIERGVLVTNWGASISHTVAEHALLLTLAALRNLPRWAGYMPRWGQPGEPPPRRAMATRSLTGKRVGIHGFGAVARNLVRLLEPFDVEIASYSQGVPSRVFRQHGVQECSSLAELFRHSEVLLECEALTPASEGSVTEAVLRELPPGAVFVNVGRGALVDEAALVRVARENALRLGLDVFAREPLPPDSALFSLADCLVSPHIAGPTEDCFEYMWDFACRNVQTWLNGEPPQEGVITAEMYDRST